MAYDEQLAARVREALAGREALSERKMGFVFVAARGVETDDGLRSWVEQAAEFAASLAPR